MCFRLSRPRHPADTARSAPDDVLRAYSDQSAWAAAGSRPLNAVSIEHVLRHIDRLAFYLAQADWRSHAAEPYYVLSASLMSLLVANEVTWRRVQPGRGHATGHAFQGRFAVLQRPVSAEKTVYIGDGIHDLEGLD